jgi:hypothetical protein
VLVGILAARIHDGRFLRLVGELLTAGYLEDWRFNATLSGTPQGGVASPILANIYLDRFDQWVETMLLPTYNRGIERRLHPEYYLLGNRSRWLEKKGRHSDARVLRRQMQRLPSRDPNDPDYRRMRYIRYADDFLLGFIGPRAEAEEIKRQIGTFLQETLKLELAESKTLITHAQTSAARFLGYEVSALKEDTARKARRRRINGVIGLRVPMDVVRSKCKPYMHNDVPVSRPERIHDSVFSIVDQYQTEYRGIVEYYRLAFNLHRFGRLKQVMETSLTKTLSHKLRISVSQVYKRFKTVLQTPNGPYKGLQVTVKREGRGPLVAKWGGIPLRRNLEVVLEDQPLRFWHVRTDLLQRLLADKCELCGSQKNVEVHHIRALKHLKQRGRAEKPEWAKAMIAKHRKSLVVCRTCHMDIQHGRPRRRVASTRATALPDQTNAPKASCS